MATDYTRPDPDSLLAQVQAEESAQTRGKLRIFLGYAAGVGKTYAMLEAARQRKEEGMDVVVGYVETHGRIETEALLTDFEMIPRRQSNYRGVILAEMDVDAILLRRPQIVLVDELAHTNIPDSRHRKRYQDVEELLEAGIDVYTTVNIQHIESLNDVVAQITGVRIYETIPDRILDHADQIELIDLPTEDLLQRLKEGKVYMPEQANRALQKFFRQGNLTALREIAMRRAAKRVDDQMRAYMQVRSIPGPWPAGEYLMVCIGPSPLSPRLVRTGRRLAQQLNAEWCAIHVETPDYANMDEASRTRLVQTMRLAEELGAKVVSLPGNSVPDTLIQYARTHNITQIIIGHPLRSRWTDFWHSSLVNRLVQLSGEIDVYVISSSAKTNETTPIPQQTPQQKGRYIVEVVLLVVLATILGKILDILVSPANLAMIYLLGVVVAAVRLGYFPAVITAVVSVITFNFFFVPPRLTFRVTDAQYLITFSGLLLVGTVVANLTARARAQAAAAQRREAQTAALYSLSRELSATIELDKITQTVVNHVSQTFQCEAGVFLPQDSMLMARAQTPHYPFGTDERAVATWAYEHSQMAGQGTDTLPSASARYLPLKTGQSTVGILGMKLSDHHLSPEQQRLIDAFANQAALAIEATYFAEKARQAQLLQETEKLQTALLSSISHDLRTPLVSITGALSSLRETGDYFDDAARKELLDGAWEEANRLNRLVGNLLEMTRLQAGAIKLKRELYDLQEVIGVARSQLKERLKSRQLIIDFPDDFPLVPLDFVLMVQVVTNLLDNAVKYSPSDAPIEISAYVKGNIGVLEVADRGIGIAENELPYVFKKFYRTSSTEGIGGTGLGLSICEGIVEAHGGTIKVKNRRDGGAVFTIMLPLKEAEES